MPPAFLTRLRFSQNPPPSPVRRAIRLNNGFQLLFNLHWWMPVFYTYQRQAGLSVAEIFTIQSIYYVAFCLLEIPTGLIADRLGPRRCLCLGAVVMAAANLVPVAQPTYNGFLIHFLLIAAARSLVSGAASAYLYEFLHAHGAGDRYLQAEGSARALGLTAKIACWPLAGLLMGVVHSAPYWLSALCSAASLFCALALRELPKITQSPSGDLPLRRVSTVRNVTRVLRSTPQLGPLILQGVAIFTLARICQVNLFQPLLLDKNIPTANHGAVLSAMTIAETVTSARPKLILRYLRGTTAVYTLSLIMAMCLAITTISDKFATVAWLCIFAAAAGMAFPIQRRLVNDAIPPGGNRATLLSLESLIDRAACALVAFAVGAYLSADRLNALLVHAALGTCLLLAAVAILLRATRPRQDDGDSKSAVAG